MLTPLRAVVANARAADAVAACSLSYNRTYRPMLLSAAFYPSLTRSWPSTHPFCARMRHAISIDVVLVAQRVWVWRRPFDSHVRATHDQLAYEIHAVLSCVLVLLQILTAHRATYLDMVKSPHVHDIKWRLRLVAAVQLAGAIQSLPELHAY